MQPVRVRVGENTDFVVTQVVEICIPRIDTQGNTDVMHFLRRQDLSESTSQVFRILPRSGMIAWVLRSRACFAEPPAESSSTRKISQSSGSCDVQSASFPGNAGPETTFLRTTFLAALSRFCAFDYLQRYLVTALGVLIQPQGKIVFDYATDKGSRLARRQTFFGLP